MKPAVGACLWQITVASIMSLAGSEGRLGSTSYKQDENDAAVLTQGKQPRPVSKGPRRRRK